MKGWFKFLTYSANQLLYRDEDINKLVDNINKLNQLFKDMNQLVIEQGTIVDRIDYNIEKAQDSSTRAKKELVKVEFFANKLFPNCG